VYARTFLAESTQLDHGVLVAAVLSAFAGALLGNRYLKNMTMKLIQRLVAVMLVGLALALMSGLL